MRVFDGKVPKKDRVWLRGCLKFAEEQSSLPVRSHQAARTNASGAAPTRLLLRRRGRQGPPYKCSLLRELLWDWFVDMRRSFATTISPKFVLMKARQIADCVVEAQRETGIIEAMPTLDRHWLLRWKRDKGVVFRRPNVRFKCSRPVLLARMRAMWVNNIRIRRLAELSFGSDLRDRIFGIDEKPIHFNESGSKVVRTLEIAGAPSVRLKENHAATRERVSVMTCVCSSPAVASQPRKLPIELLFKAKSEKRTRSLRLPDDTNVSLQWATKGSYRQEHILRYLDRWLDPWTDERARIHDYRILMMDVAGSHVGDEVVDFAWTRGYIALFHYGCTTGVGQVNDTDLHGPFEREYLDHEQAAFNEQQMLRPGSVARTPQDVVEDVVATWRSLDHGQVAAGHRRTALSIALDGSEDSAVSREALECWQALNMPAVRRDLIAEVEEKVASGLWTFANWRAVVQHPVNPGVLADEGMEFEGDVEGKCWEGEEDEKQLAADDAEVLGSDAAAVEGPIVPQLPGDSIVAVAEADASAKRLLLLKRLRSDARAAAVPGAFFCIDKEVSQLERGRKAKSPLEKEAHSILRRHVEAKVAVERENAKRRRETTRKADLNVKRIKARIARTKQIKKNLLAKKVAFKKKVDALPKVVSAADCAQPGHKGFKARVDCLERLKLRCPPLPFAARVRWADVRDAYSRRMAKMYKEKSVGPAFIDKINHVLKKLGEHYQGISKFNKVKGCGGNPEAFAAFFAAMDAYVPKAASTIEM